MIKKALVILFIMTLTRIYSMDKAINIEIRNIREGSGKTYVAVFDSETSYKEEKPFKSYIVESNSTVVRITDKLPEGYYLVSAFQDLNGNGKLDMNFLGIPKEPIGLSNYEGKGIPGGFDKMKIKVSVDNQTIIIKMIKIF